jgi:hypothetical protein
MHMSISALPIQLVSPLQHDHSHIRGGLLFHENCRMHSLAIFSSCYVFVIGTLLWGQTGAAVFNNFLVRVDPSLGFEDGWVLVVLIQFV